MGTWKYDDGGRARAGYLGEADDCGARAIAIATRCSYRDAYDLVNEWGAKERSSKLRSGNSSARTGVYTATFRRIMDDLGWVWTPTMGIGTGTTVHLRADELPSGRLIVKLSKHLVAVVNGVVRDTHDPTRDGTRCVYGYWQDQS